MRILFAGANDWAHISHRVARGLRAVGHDARVWVVNAHPFQYEETGSGFVRHTDLENWIVAGSIDWIISSGDGDYAALFAMLHSLPVLPHRLATMHVGSAYRNHSAFYNRIDRMFDLRFVGGDLFVLADGTDDGPRAVPFFAPLHAVAAGLVDLPGPVRVVHTPSNRGVKGTSEIVGMIPGVEILEWLPFLECARRRAECHVFIDQLNDLGGYGAAAVEALASGCAVLGSTAKIAPVVSSFYPPPPIVEVTRENLAAVVADLRADPVRVTQLRAQSLAWAACYATPQAIGMYWAALLELAVPG